MNKLTRGLNKVGFVVKKHSPEILVGLGVVGMVTSTVMACRATTKLDRILAENKDKVDDIKHLYNHPEKLKEGTTYTEEDVKKDLTIVYSKTGLDILKLYGPSVIVGSLSIASIFASSVILKKRNLALAAAYTTVDKTFKDYRGRVVEKFGKEVDKQLKYGIKAMEVEKDIEDEEGNQRTVKETVEVVEEDVLSNCSPYAKFFDELSDYWVKDADINLLFLRAQEDFANRKLKSKGYLFLNEVYNLLGIPETRAGQVIGWVYDKDIEHKIDFGIYNLNRMSNRAFVNGYERAILLDFNVDGNIWEQM